MEKIIQSKPVQKSSQWTRCDLYQEHRMVNPVRCFVFFVEAAQSCWCERQICLLWPSSHPNAKGYFAKRGLCVSSCWEQEKLGMGEEELLKCGFQMFWKLFWWALVHGLVWAQLRSCSSEAARGVVKGWLVGCQGANTSVRPDSACREGISGKHYFCCLHLCLWE